MRRALLALPVLLLTLAEFPTTPALAEDGTLTVEILEAEVALTAQNKDDWTNQQQDFFVRHAIDFGPHVFAEKISDRDHPFWIPPQFNTNFKLVPMKNQRFFDLYFELWDDDSCFTCGSNPPDDFDINPQNGPPPKPFITYDPNWQNGGFPHVNYDVCTGDMYVKGVLGSSPIPIGSSDVEVKGNGTTSGTPDNYARLHFRVKREPPNWLPEDVAVSLVSMVQAVYEPTRAVVDKPTSMKVVVDSTYPYTLPAPLHGEMTDGYTTVADNRLVNITPGRNVFYLFEGTTAPPYLPFKPIWANTGTLSGFAELLISETVSPNAPVQLMDCANLNNIGNATSLPLIRTQDPKVVYRRYDYSGDKNFISVDHLQVMFDEEERFRLATWPLASLNSSTDTALLDHAGVPFFEPAAALVDADKLAFLAGIDRLVLSVRQDWFFDNAFFHSFANAGSKGLSLGPVVPRAVLAEDGYWSVAVHELGHSFWQSQHKCTAGGILESMFSLSCCDEYLHEPPYDNPYEARGFDVQGLVYPSGKVGNRSLWPSLECPTTPPAARDICAPNIMDTNPLRIDDDGNTYGTYENWIDNLTFEDLFTRLNPGIDPLVVKVSGSIVMPVGPGDGVVPPPVFGMLDPFAYQALGTQDLPAAPLSQMGEAFSGTGAFRIRLRSPIGVRDHRFDPMFFEASGGPEVRGFFSLAIPFDPMTTSVELVVPMDLLAPDCMNRFCPGNELTVSVLPRTPLPPGVANLRAGRDVAPPIMPPAPPIIGPGHGAVLAWNAADPDSPETRAAVLVWRQDPGGNAGPPVPMSIDVGGGTYHIPHAALAGGPGTYSGKVVVTDGVNTSELAAGPLFTICNFSNGGVEQCNGVDDDCDGLVDNGVALPGSEYVQLNPHPLPPGSVEIGWDPDPQAQSFDVVYGSVNALRASGGNFTAAILGCVANDVTAGAVVADPVPLVGEGFFYLVRGSNCAGPGTWDSGAASQAGPRDPGINAAPNSCAP